MHKWCKALLVLLLIAVAPGFVAAKADQKVTITNGGDALQYFPIYIARGGGFFAKEGIDVDWVNVNSGSRQAASVMGGSADFSTLALLHVIKVAAQNGNAAGGDLVAIANVFNVYGMTMVLSNDAIAKSGIKPGMSIDEKVRRLHGLRIGISSPGSSTDAFVRSLFLARGLKPDSEVKLQPFGTGAAIYAAFENKLTDGFAYPAPIPETAAAAGLGQVIIDPFTGEVPELNGVPYVVLATSRETLSRKPAVVAAVMRGLTNAVNFIAQHPDQAKKMMRQYFPDIDAKVFDLAVSNYIKGSPQTLLITPDQINKAVTWMNAGEEKKINVTYNSVVAAEPAQQAAAAAVVKQ